MLRALACLAVLAGGCHDPNGSVSVGKGKRVPGSPLDSGDGRDGEIDALDGSIRLQDGAIVPIDGGDAGPDGGGDPDSFDPTGCKLDEDNELMLDVPFDNEGGFALTPAVDGPGFGLAFLQDGTCAETIDAAPVASTGPFAKAAAVVADAPTCYKITELTLLSTLDGFRLGWLDNSAGSAGLEVQTMLLDDALHAGVKNTRKRLTNNALVEHFLVSANVANAPIFAWYAVDNGTIARKRSLWAQRIDGTSPPVKLITESADHMPNRLAIAEMGSKTDVTNGVVAWIEEVAERGVWAQRIGVDGKPAGDPVRVSQLASAGSSVDVATRDGDGGALIYETVVDSSREVRFRRLDHEGNLFGGEVKIVSQPLQGGDPSIVRISGGYAVAYRALPAAGSRITSPQIRVTFISKEGTVRRDVHGELISYEIAPAAEGGGRTTVRLSNDGQLLVGFVDDDGTSHPKLELARKRLDCEP